MLRTQKRRNVSCRFVSHLKGQPKKFSGGGPRIRNTSMGGAHTSSLSKLKQHAYWKYGDASLERRATHAGEGTESKRVSSRK
jgi:hypothetical protein